MCAKISASTGCKCKPLLYQLRVLVSRVVRGPTPERLPHHRTLVFGPLPERLLALSLLTHAQEQRRDTFSSSFDGRMPRASPSRTRGLGSPRPRFNSLSSRNLILQLSEFEAPCLYPRPLKHFRSTMAAFTRLLASAKLIS